LDRRTVAKKVEYTIHKRGIMKANNPSSQPYMTSIKCKSE
jgi:hypothetical protein